MCSFLYEESILEKFWLAKKPKHFFFVAKRGAGGPGVDEGRAIDADESGKLRGAIRELVHHHQHHHQHQTPSSKAGFLQEERIELILT